MVCQLLGQQHTVHPHSQDRWSARAWPCRQLEAHNNSGARKPPSPGVWPLSTHPFKLAKVAQHVLHHLAHVPAVQQQRLLELLYLRAQQLCFLCTSMDMAKHKQSQLHSRRSQTARGGPKRTSFGSRFSRMRRALLDLGLSFLANSAACISGSVITSRSSRSHSLCRQAVCSVE